MTLDIGVSNNPSERNSLKYKIRKVVSKMKKENVSQANLKNQEVSKMSTANVPYTNKQLLKWSAFRIEKSKDYKKPYELIQTSLVELVKKPGYEQFKDRLNWLYNNFSEKNYQIVWSEIQRFNNRRREVYIQENIIAKADYILNKQIEEYAAHFGPMPKWVDKLNDNQRALLLDRARTCYGLEPEEVILETKQVYTVPQRVIKELSDEGITYYSQEELSKTRLKDKVKNNCYNDVVGRVKVYSNKLKRLAENAVLRDERWMAQFNNTEFDLREHREVEGDENGNKMVPITDLQGPDSPYGLDVEFRDFLEPIYEDEGL